MSKKIIKNLNSDTMRVTSTDLKNEDIAVRIFVDKLKYIIDSGLLRSFKFKKSVYVYSHYDYEVFYRDELIFYLEIKTVSDNKKYINVDKINNLKCLKRECLILYLDQEALREIDVKLLQEIDFRKVEIFKNRQEKFVYDLRKTKSLSETDLEFFVMTCIHSVDYAKIRVNKKRASEVRENFKRNSFFQTTKTL